MKEFEVRNPPLIPPLIGGNLLPWQNMRLKGTRSDYNQLAFHQGSSPLNMNKSDSTMLYSKGDSERIESTKFNLIPFLSHPQSSVLDILWHNQFLQLRHQSGKQPNFPQIVKR